MSESFIEEFANKVKWNGISETQDLSIPFIEKHKNDLDWGLLAKHPRKFEESFIELHTSRWDWRNISEYQVLSESFIERHEFDVDWKTIFQYQELSDEFRKKWEWKIRE